MKRLRYLPLLFAAGLVTVAALLPNVTLASLREALPWFSELINRVEALWPGVDSTHVLLFFFVGVALVIALPRRPPLAALAQAMACVVLLAAVSELVQFFVPGRTPLWSDFRDDLLGGGVGVGVGLVVGALAQRILRVANGVLTSRGTDKP
jgi:VanZ family protein